MIYKKLLVAMLGIVLLLSAAQTSQAVLNAVDPGPYVAANGFFPQWYQDTSAIALDLCLSTAAGPNGPMCILLPNLGIFDPALPIVFPTNFPDESFWFAADAIVSGPGVTQLRYVAAVEAAFGSGVPAANDQITFSRIRIVGTVTTPGTYVVTHPYGQEIFEVPTTGNRAIAFTRDIGIGAPGDFTGALNGDVGPFLRASTGLITVGTEQFIGDPNVTQAVVGSPFGTNFLSVQGPLGIAETNQFTLAGKISAVVLPTPLIVDRTTYSSNALQTQIDVFATSAPTATLSFDVTGATGVPMGGDAIRTFFGQALVPPATLGPVTITAANTGNTTTISPASALTDLVFITRAEYSLSTGELVIEASSSDETALPTLTAAGFGALATPVVLPTFSGSFAAAIPPATVTVTSAAGGSDTEDVIVLP